MTPTPPAARALAWRSGGGAPLDALDVAALRRDLLEDGVVALRDHGGGLGAFARLTRLLVPHPMHAAVHRQPHPLHRHVKTATPGSAAQGFHADYAHLPTRVDVMAFHCQVPGARMRVCDGAALWSALDEATRAHLEHHPLVLASWHDASAWMAATGTTSLAEVEAHARTTGTYRVEPGALGGIITRVTRHAAEVHRGRICLVQNLWTDAYASLQLLTEDGTPYDPAVLRVVHRVADDVAWDVMMQPGDTLLLDNRRMLHARDAQPATRRMWAVLGNW